MVLVELLQELMQGVELGAVILSCLCVDLGSERRDDVRVWLHKLSQVQTFLEQRNWESDPG